MPWCGATADEKGFGGWETMVYTESQQLHIREIVNAVVFVNSQGS